MKEWLSDLWDAALFRPVVYDELRRRPDAFLQGTIIVVIVALLAGIPSFVQELWQGSRVTQASENAEARAALRNALEAGQLWTEQLSIPPSTWAEIVDQVEQNFAMAAQIAEQVENLPTPLPRPVGRFLAALGGWLSQPFAVRGIPLATVSLGAWLGYSILVMLAAKLLGGRATLHGFLGASALYAVPHVLDVFRWIPFFGWLIGLIAILWGAAIYVKATQWGHELSLERALLAVLLPAIVLFAILVLIVSILAGVSALR
jgi:hypothetical protein